MAKSWAASLMIGVMVGAALLALYKVTGIFFKGALWIEDIYTMTMVHPPELRLLAPLQYGFYTAMAFISAFVCAELPRYTRKAAYLLGALFLTLTLSPVLAFGGILFEPFSGMAAILLAGLGGMFYGATDDGRRGSEMSQWLTGRMAAPQLKKLLESPGAVELCSKREITVLTCRILNYPELCRLLEPAEIEETITSFMTEASRHLGTLGGYLDSCNVEGVRAVFGLAESLGDHAVPACQAALSLQRHLDAWKDRTHTKAVVGSSLATGPAAVGLFGDGNFAQISVVGEPLDFGRRLCSINYVYGSKVLLSARTYHMAKEAVEARPMEMVSAPRMHNISEVYELLDEKGHLTDEETRARDAFWHGVVSLRKGAYRDAVGHLKRAQVEGKEDAPLKYFLERAEAGVRDDQIQTQTESKLSSKHVRLLTAG